MNNSQLPNSFNDLINQSELPVLVDFWAEWCGPCKMMAPVLKQVAGEFKGRLMVVKVNVDEKPQVAAAYQVQGIPTLILFHKGRILARQTGAVPFERLKSLITGNLPA